MQIKYLTLAMTAALALNLTACKDDKSSDDTDKTPVASNPTTPVASNPVTSNPVTSNPVTSNPVTSGPINDQNNVGDAATGGDLAKKFTAGTQQYTRNKKSKFDLTNNPRGASTMPYAEDGSSAASNFVKLQNEEFANIVLARNSAARDADRITFYLGTRDDSLNSKALQDYNIHARRGGTSANLEANYVEANLTAATNRPAITDIASSNTKPDSGLVYVGARPLNSVGDQVANNGAAKTAVGTLGNTKDKMIRAEQIVVANNAGLPNVSTAYYNSKGETYDITAANQGLNVVGKEELMTQSLSRIFGAYYKEKDSSTKLHVKNNSYAYNDLSGNYKKSAVTSGPNIPTATNGYSGLEDATGGPTSNVQHAIFENDALNNDKKGFAAGITQISLENVQYGRVTTNLNIVEDIKKSNAAAGKLENLNDRLYYQIDVTDSSTNGDIYNFLQTTVNDQNAVNNYFYRGINRTGEGNVTALPKSGKGKYFGHAIMYGIDNSFHGGQKQDSNSNSLGGTPSSNLLEAVGNFVQSTVDFQSQKVTGSVYNVWHKSDGTVVRDDLVKFNGKIVGKNNVSGTAERIYTTGDNADFRASFFGNGGSEMGGSFNSIKQKDGKGQYGQVNWGGVFGSKLLGSSSGFETENQ